MLADSQTQLRDAGRRRWGRQDHQAVADAHARVAAAESRLEQAIGVERDLRERLTALAKHEQRRQEVVAELAPRRREIDTTLAQIDAALAHTRPDRVAPLADDPPEYLLTRIGPVPDTPAGRAVWCHHALDIEANLDRNGGRSPAWSGWSPQTDRARRQIAVADRVLEASSDRPGPREWAELTQQAAAVLDEVRRAERNRARTRPPGQRQQPHRTPRIDPVAERRQPGISL